MKKRLALASILILAFISIEAQRAIRGHVTDHQGTPLIGANILVKNTAIGTTTDIDGAYELDLPVDALTLVFSYIGFQSQEIDIGGQSTIDVALIAQATTLEEVVMVGFGTSTRRKLTSSIASVDAEAYEGAAKTNPLQALQGRMAGVQIVQSSGATSSAMAVRVRGQTSINASNQPLIVIDGVITDTWTGYNFGGPGASRLIGIEPNDIESVEVLKDGAAAAIYGSRGANGVILITTKQGQFNTRPKVTLSYQGGLSDPTVRPEVMTGPEYARAWNRAAEAIGGLPPQFLYEDPDSEPTTDWYDLLTRTALFHDAHAAVSGGSQTTNYHIGAGFRNEEDYFITKGLERFSLQAKVNQLIDDRWQAGMSINASRTEQERFWEGVTISHTPTVSSTWFPSNVEAFDATGDPKLLFSAPSYSLNWSPLIDLTEREDPQILSQIRMGTNVEFSALTNLQLRTEFNAEFSHWDARDINGRRTRFGRPDGYIIGESNADQNFHWTNTATWTTHPGVNDELILLLGNQLQWHSWEAIHVEGAGFSDERLQDIASAGEITGGWTYGEEYKFAGYFARANYALANKYFLAASARLDGSSRFGSNNRWGFFPAFSAGWMLSEEPFFTSRNIDFLKISASVGQTGNAEIGNFESRALLGFLRSYNGLPGSAINSLGNNDLTWEETTQYDVSLSFGLWQDRLNGTVSWFLKNTDGLLFEVPVPATNGVTSLFQNAGAVRNSGWEFDLKTTLRPGPQMSVKLGVNGAYVRNEITALPDTDGDGIDDDIISFGTILRVGEDMSSLYLVRYAGVDPANGDALFYDLQGNTIPMTTPLSNRVIAGRGAPDFTGGLSLEVAYRGVFLSSLFQGALGHEIFVGYGPSFDGFLSPWNKDRLQLESWTPDNTQTEVPEARLFTDNGNEFQSTRWLVDGDYLRLKNLQIGYRFNDLGRRSTSLTLYAAGQNLWTLTQADRIDPEVSRSNVNEPQLAFNNFSVTLPRSFSFGIKVEM